MTETMRGFLMEGFAALVMMSVVVVGVASVLRQLWRESGKVSKGQPCSGLVVEEKNGERHRVKVGSGRCDVTDTGALVITTERGMVCWGSGEWKRVLEDLEV